MDQTWIIIVVIIALIFLIWICAGGVKDTYCNCTGMGIQTDKPLHTFWRGAWPRSRWTTPLNITSRWGSWPKKCMSKNLGWAQTPGRPFDSSPRCTANQPYEMNEAEFRDSVRDCHNDLSLTHRCSSTCSNNMYHQSLVPLGEIPGAQLPHRAVTGTGECDDDHMNNIRFGSGRSCNDQAVGVL